MRSSLALWVGLALLVGAGTLAIAGAERDRRRWVMLGKPVATASLLLVAGLPHGAYGWLVVVGLVLSMAGDIALIGSSQRGLQAGIAIFLGAHLCYVAAFLREGGPGGFWPGLPVLVASAALVVALWPGLGKLRLPVIVYAAALSATVIAAFGTRVGPLPPAATAAACVGACLFYLSDIGVAWTQFRKRFPHSAFVTMGVYWLGQLGIALSARWAG